MAENTLNLKQIQDKLLIEYNSQERKIVFWYDDEGDFADDIDNLKLSGVETLKLEQGNQFAVKRRLEREDKDTHFLIYAPFPKPAIEENHLEDVLLYSTRFYADRVSLLVHDLGLDESMKSIVQQYVKFFASQERVKRFLELNMGEYTEHNFCLGIMCALCKLKSCNYDELLLQILLEEKRSSEANKYMAELGKYGLADKFWIITQQQFGYVDNKHALKRLLATMYLTYFCHYIEDEAPTLWKNFISNKIGNIMTFVDRLMNNIQYQPMFDSESDKIAAAFKIKELASAYPLEQLIDVNLFRQIDDIFIDWIVERLLNEDLGAKVRNMGIRDLCQHRKKLHFGAEFADSYDALYYAYGVLEAAHFSCGGTLMDMINAYCEHHYGIDYCYRQFYVSYDKIGMSDNMGRLKTMVENIYTSKYLGQLLPAWSNALIEYGALGTIPKQRDFFNNYVKKLTDRAIVIISDGLRYEVGHQLYDKLKDEVKVNVTIASMLSALPSYTRMGMAALLPHKELELQDDGNVLADGERTNDLPSRAKILQKQIPNSACVQASELMTMNRAQIREIFTGKQVVYVYHDQIDNAGEHNENTVFASCQTAVDELMALIQKLAGNANTLHFIITADHGFIYKRDKVSEKGKIDGVSDNQIVKKRYIVSESPVDDAGVYSIKLGDVLGTAESRHVSMPMSSNVFKARGGGYNYVHGGSSPQEMLIPVLDIKMEKYHQDTSMAHISMLSMMSKVSSRKVYVEFFQSEAVTDAIKEATYKICFMDEEGTVISNENIYTADSRETESNKRFFKMQFMLKNQVYDTSKKYFIVAVNVDTDSEIIRYGIKIDIASDDYGL